MGIKFIMINACDVELMDLNIDDKEFLIRFEPNEIFVYCINLNLFHMINYDTYKFLLLIKEYGYENVSSKIGENNIFSDILKELGVNIS